MRVRLVARCLTLALVMALLAPARAAEPATLAVPQSPEQRQGERAGLLRQGETALSRGEVEQALHLFERAALLEHAADTEIALVRTHMQAGNYRQAVSFSAHTAGAHRQEVEGVALYAWLLAIGAQQDAAGKLLADAAGRFGADPNLTAVRRLIETPAATPRAGLAGVRLTPYRSGRKVPPGARIVASGVLIDRGRHALVPLSRIGGARTLWLRNGLGQTTEARVERRDGALGLALLRLAPALTGTTLARALGDASAETLLQAAAERDPFPGSPVHAAEFAATGSTDPAWPRLHSGFHGMPDGQEGRPHLGIEMPAGPHGGPVFDSTGHWAGIALPDADGSARLVTISRLRRQFGDLLGPGVAAAPAVRATVEEVYEGALRGTLQVMVGR